MHCTSCETAIKESINKIDGIEEIIVDYVTEKGEVTFDLNKISIEKIFNLIGEKGYEFRNWEDSSTNPTRTVNLVSDMYITAYYDVTIIPEFPTSIAWLLVVGVATPVIVLGARKLKPRSESHRDFHAA